jgi:glycerol-3-phosphate acyltransferase PlsX
MRIVLDAAGGDNAPQETVRGAVMAARAFGCTVVLAGPADQVRAELARHDTAGLDLPVVDAPDVIAMNEHPVQAARRKSRSPHVVGLRLVRQGEADAFVSAGHSGATMAAATFVLGRIQGIARPALAVRFPALERDVLLLDIGATTDCKPEYLLQFAQLGAVYAERALDVSQPRVALLANGEEDSKGDRLVQEAHALLRHSPLHFVGNAEPKDALVGGVCDVLVCDGFVGNLFIKTSEAVMKLALQRSLREVRRGLGWRLAAGLLPPAVLAALAPRSGRLPVAVAGLLGGPALVGSALGPPLLRVRQVADYRSHGGAPLLGLRGVAIVAHGRSDAAAIMSAIRQARDAVIRGAVTGVAAVLESGDRLQRAPQAI